MIYKQYDLAERTQNFICRYGLKKNYVARKCDILRESFSRWTNHHYMLADDELKRVEAWIDDYERRMSP
mgnify:CR=1 FL=1